MTADTPDKSDSKGVAMPASNRIARVMGGERAVGPLTHEGISACAPDSSQSACERPLHSETRACYWTKRLVADMR